MVVLSVIIHYTCTRTRSLTHTHTHIFSQCIDVRAQASSLHRVHGNAPANCIWCIVLVYTDINTQVYSKQQ